MSEPKGERRCAVGVGPEGEPIFEQFVRKAWADAEIVHCEECSRLAALMPEVERVLEAMIGVCEVHAFKSFAIKLEALLAKIQGA